jgi:hypothetical protein
MGRDRGSRALAARCDKNTPTNGDAQLAIVQSLIIGTSNEVVIDGKAFEKVGRDVQESAAESAIMSTKSAECSHFCADVRRLA